MMEVECSTPRGSPTPDGSPPRHHSPPSTTIIPSMTSIRPTPTITYKSSNGNSNGMVTTRLTPLSEYEVSSSAAAIATTLTPTASPQMNGRHLFNGNNLTLASQHHFHNKMSAGPPTPSPDSAIHSAYYSPSQSPVQSRHVSGFSSESTSSASAGLSFFSLRYYFLRSEKSPIPGKAELLLYSMGLFWNGGSIIIVIV